MTKKEQCLQYFNRHLISQLELLSQLRAMLPPGLPPHRQATLLYAFLFDRAPIPLQFWGDKAAATYFNEGLQYAKIPFPPVDGATLRKWIQTLGVSISAPLVVTGYSITEGITGFDLGAFELHGIPQPETTNPLNFCEGPVGNQ